MKLTHPFVVLGIGVGMIVVALAAVELMRAEPPSKTVEIQSTATTTTKVLVKTEEDSVELRRVYADLEERDKRWSDSVDLASSAARITLAPIIQDMQAQVRDNEKLELPECLKAGKPHWLEGQQEVVKGLIAFMGREETVFQTHMDLAVRAHRNYRAVLDACRPASAT